MMVVALAPPVRLIEYPEDVSDCKKLNVQGRDLLHYIVRTGNGSSSSVIVVVLGYVFGQRQDIVTKDLIETIDNAKKAEVRSTLMDSLALSPSTAILFL